MDVMVWLRNLGLGKYEAVFSEDDIDETVLPSPTHENLKELGVASFGHRVKLLDAIAALRRDADVQTPAVAQHPLDRLRRPLQKLLASAAISQ
jgi:SAM domain (Sterile alpha motif)